MRLSSILRKALQVMLIPALLSWGGQAYAQQQLSGKVVDNAGEPVIGRYYHRCPDRS